MSKKNDKQLVREIAAIIERGMNSDQPPLYIAVDIVETLKEKAAAEVKATRPMGWVSQHDLFRGK